jgi:hypothetical protein
MFIPQDRLPPDLMPTTPVEPSCFRSHIPPSERFKRSCARSSHSGMKGRPTLFRLAAKPTRTKPIMATAPNTDRDMRRLATLEAVARPFLHSHASRLVTDAHAPPTKDGERATGSADDRSEQAS